MKAGTELVSVSLATTVELTPIATEFCDAVTLAPLPIAMDPVDCTVSFFEFFPSFTVALSPIATDLVFVATVLLPRATALSPCASANRPTATAEAAVPFARVPMAIALSAVACTFAPLCPLEPIAIALSPLAVA